MRESLTIGEGDVLHSLFRVCLSFEIEQYNYATEKSLNYEISITLTRFATAVLQTVAKRCLSSDIHFFDPQLKPTICIYAMIAC